MTQRRGDDPLLAPAGERQAREFLRETGNLRRCDSDRASSYEGPAAAPAQAGPRGGAPAPDDGLAPAADGRHAPATAPDFRGRGPVGYRRSDARLFELVCEALTEDPLVDASDILVGVHDGAVTLDGTVASDLQRRRALALAGGVYGVVECHDALHVRAPGERPSGVAPGDERTMTGERLSVVRQQHG